MKKFLLFYLLFLMSFQSQAQISTNSLLFDGTDDLVRVPLIPAYNFGVGPFTIEAWIRDDDPPGTMYTNRPIMSCRTGFQHPDGFLLTLLDGNLVFFCGGGGSGLSTFDFRDGTCHHIALTGMGVSGGGFTCYIDGVWAGGMPGDSLGFTSDFFIGNSPDDVTFSYFKGLIKEVRLWNVLRTQSQVQSNMNTVLSGAANPNLVGYWRFNDAGIQTLTDYSTHQNHATLGSGTAVEPSDPAPTTGCPACAPLPSGSITAGSALTFCTGNSVTLTATAGAGLTYQWKKDGVLIPGATQAAYAAASSGAYLCAISNSCGSIATNVLTVTAQSSPSVNISFNYPNVTFVCAGGYTTLYASAAAGITFQWKLNGTVLAGATSALYNADSAGNYTCIASNTCGSIVSNTLALTAGSPPPATITPAGPTTFCNGKSVVLNANTGSWYTYLWRKDGLIISTYGSSYTATVTGNYQVNVSVANTGCTAASAGTQVTVSPSTTPATLTPTGTIVNCGGGSVVFNANTGAGLTYVWHFYQYYIPGATSSTYTTTANGDYSVSVTNSSGCVSTSPVTSVTINAPAGPLSVNGNSTSNCGGSIVSLSSSSSEFGLTYQWKLNGSVIPGATKGYYIATTSGSYSFIATNSCGSVTSSAKTVTFVSFPSAVITPGGPLTFCSGGSVVLNAPVSTNRSYQWLKGGVNIAGATHSNYTATIGGTYKVTVTNTSTGCSKTTATGTQVTVTQKPPAIVTPQGPTTFCAGGSVILQANTGTVLTYKWKKGSNYISGATASAYTAALAGTYKAEVTNSGGCSKTSAGVVVTVPCREEESTTANDGFDFSIIPNPTTGIFTIEFKNKPKSGVEIELTDATGKVIAEKLKINSESVVINKTNLAAGMYFLAATTHESRMVKKINVIR